MKLKPNNTLFKDQLMITIKQRIVFSLISVYVELKFSCSSEPVLNTEFVSNE